MEEVPWRGARFGFLNSRMFLAYSDISPFGDSDFSDSAVFEALCWAKGIEGATRVYSPEVEI